ncbi:tail protein [Escherichia phage vB_EcoM_ECO1230-10]|uniref:Putative phage tail protein n=1 Tax=Escherichia phage vB_EcoM_ECO1230-10 TaxID=669875 RepID=D5LGZ2_9CAUD|nr:tail protein [Escherichia phage vB_EcoM_ECO1230-10]ADE87923.1 putative phage tail protein [Escherichia phage vB_EcoM_ECO1230-10]
MSDLLPSNATAQERALAGTVARISDVPVVVREVWNPDTCPVSVLPWLAWAFSVDDWDTNWTEQQKRDTIKQSIVSQRIKGTIGAVKRQLAALGLDIRIVEWFRMATTGAPYTFEVYITIDQTSATQADLNRIKQIIDTNKNLRSHMVKTSLTVKSTAVVRTGIIAGVGSEISITNYVRSVGALNDYVMPQANISIGD